MSSTESGIHTLKNYGSRRNCSISIIYPETVELASVDVGVTSKETVVVADYGISSKVKIHDPIFSMPTLVIKNITTVMAIFQDISAFRFCWFLLGRTQETDLLTEVTDHLPNMRLYQVRLTTWGKWCNSFSDGRNKMHR